MKAMIFAAGLGTRLHPHTADRPKALVEVGNRTLLEWAVMKLQKHGVDQILVNVHHFSGKMKAFLEAKSYFGGSVTISDESQQVLETGGGLKNAAWFFDDGLPFLVYNVDVLTDFNLSDFYHAHLESGALASLAVRTRETSRYLLVDRNNILCGWEHAGNEEVKLARLGSNDLQRRAFSGIHVINPELLGMMTRNGKFSIIDTYLDLASKHEIRVMPHDDSFWMDIGKPETLKKARELYNSGLLGSLL